ncbi:MAG: hypothetical protein J6K45_04905 [Clostridia bacterium]|nr:hypothetical protein [Clostridia bacterium]
MPKKEIEKEINEANKKANEIKTEKDVNERNNKAEGLDKIDFKINEKIYDVNELVEITDKVNKTYEEIEVAKKFKILLRNYYDGIICAALRPCCGKQYTIEDLKSKLKETKIYELIELRCSRNTIKFNKKTVDVVVELIERYELS